MHFKISQVHVSHLFRVFKRNEIISGRLKMVMANGTLSVFSDSSRIFSNTLEFNRSIEYTLASI